MSQYDFSKYRKAVVMGYSIRVVYGIYIATKRGEFKGSMSSMPTFLLNLKPIFFTMQHYKFALIFFNVTSTYNLLGRIYDRYIQRKEKRMDTKISINYAKYKKTNKIRSNVIFSMISCLWFKKLPKQFRQFIVLHLLVRSMYHLVKLYKYDEEYKVLPNIKYDEIIILSVILSIIACSMCHYPAIISPGYYKFLLKWGNNTAQQLRIMFQTPSTFTACSPNWHKEPSCFKHYTLGFFVDVFKSAKMYAIVHIIPLFIQLRFYRLIYKFIMSFINNNDDDDDDNDNDKKSARMKLFRLIINKFLSILRSSMFFSGFQHFGKLLMCWMRYYIFKSDPIYNTILSVIIGSSIAQLFEKSNRRIQYSLYLLPEIIKMAINAFYNKYGIIGYHKLYEWWDIIIIQISFGIWSYLVSINKAQNYCDKFISSFLIKTFL